MHETDDWRHELVTARDARATGHQAELYRATERGVLHRVSTGVYLPSRVWSQMDADDRFLARVHAVALRHPGHEPFCGASAAALWRLPIVGRWPELPELVCADQRGGRSRADIRRRSGRPVLATDDIDGLRVTTLPRTLVDVARWYPLTISVPMLDAALSPNGHAADPDRVRLEHGEAAADRGAVRAGRALAFADGSSGSAGESLSRVVIESLGFPAPILQVPFRDAAGLVGYVDFWWPEFDLIGEFDGVAKYVRHEFTDGRPPGEVVVAEKRREDRLRALGPRLSRWGWAEARAPRRLEAVLRAAGLPQRPVAHRNRRVFS